MNQVLETTKKAKIVDSLARGIKDLIAFATYSDQGER